MECLIFAIKWFLIKILVKIMSMSLSWTFTASFNQSLILLVLNKNSILTRQIKLSHSIGNGVAFLDSEGGARSTWLWTLLSGSTTEPHPDALPPYRATLTVMIFLSVHIFNHLGWELCPLEVAWWTRPDSAPWPCLDLLAWVSSDLSPTPREGVSKPQ